MASDKTYYLDRKTGRVRSPVEGERALRQFVWTTLETERFRHLIYNADYGAELRQLITNDLSAEMLGVEIPRIIREALLVDDRIESVTDFEIERIQDAYFVRFTVNAVTGEELAFEMGVRR